MNKKYFDNMELNHFDLYRFVLMEDKSVEFCFSCNPSGLAFGTLDRKCVASVDDGTYPQIEDIINCLITELKNDNYMEEIIDFIYNCKKSELDAEVSIDEESMKQIIKEDLTAYLNDELSYHYAKTIQDNLERIGAINE